MPRVLLLPLLLFGTARCAAAEAAASAANAPVKATDASATAVDALSDGRRHLLFESDGGADPHWWNVGGLVMGWKELNGLLQSSFLSAFYDGVREWMVCIGNVLFVVAVAVGFAVLPRRLMLILGGIGLFFGSFVAQLGLQALGGALFLSAYIPGLMVLLIWVGAFMTSRTAQRLGIWLGLDIDNDGDVDLKDLFVECCRQFSPDIHAELVKTRRKQPYEQLAERLERIERLLVKHIGPLPPPSDSDDPSYTMSERERVRLGSSMV